MNKLESIIYWLNIIVCIAAVLIIGESILWVFDYGF